MKVTKSVSTWLVALVVGGVSLPAFAQQELSLEMAIALAQSKDPWLQGNKLKQVAVEHRSVSASTLPDPTVTLGLMNLPTDTWNTEQEGMTQLKVGVAQMFPRGDSLDIKAAQLQTQATKYPLQRADRAAMLARTVSTLWLDAYLAQQTIALIEKDSALFEQMAEVAKASYSSALGKTRQQDVIRSQLELLQLEDRLTVERQKLETTLAKLNEWVQVGSGNSMDSLSNGTFQAKSFNVSTQLPSLTLPTQAATVSDAQSLSALAATLAQHPAVLAIDVQEQVALQGVSLAKQQYKPQWGVSASYAYRDNMPSGESRADLFSVGVTFDLPLFTGNKQDKLVAASIAESESIKTDKLLLIKQMISGIDKEYRQIKRLSERQQLYHTQLLQQIHDQAEASLTAYTNDDGDFAEVVRARIAELNARIAAMQIDVESLKAIARIRYFFTQFTPNQPQESHTLPRSTGEQ